MPRIECGEKTVHINGHVKYSRQVFQDVVPPKIVVAYAGINKPDFREKLLEAIQTGEKRLLVEMTVPERADIKNLTSVLGLVWGGNGYHTNQNLDLTADQEGLIAEAENGLWTSKWLIYRHKNIIPANTDILLTANRWTDEEMGMERFLQL